MLVVTIKRSSRDRSSKRCSDTCVNVEVLHSNLAQSKMSGRVTDCKLDK